MTWIITSFLQIRENFHMLAFDPSLKSQHDAIREALKELEIVWRSKDPVKIKNHMTLLYDLILHHDKTEWNLLFHPHSSRPDLNQGGPYCTYFFDSFMINRPREKAIQLLKASQKNEIVQPVFPIDDHLQELFKTNSMLTVPLEEHISIKLVLGIMIQSFDDKQNIDHPWLNQCLEFLTDLIKKNIEKEETCLWMLIQQSCMKVKS